MSLPSLDPKDRPSHARRIHAAVLQQVPANTPIRTLGRALQLHRMNPPAELETVLDDAGFLVDVALTHIIDDLWPELAKYSASQYDPDNTEIRHNFSFRQRVSGYLRDTVNMVCVRTGNRHVASRWWVRTEWFQRDPLHFALTKFGDEIPDVPEAELERLRADNDRLREDNERLRKRVHKLEQTLLAVTE